MLSNVQFTVESNSKYVGESSSFKGHSYMKKTLFLMIRSLFIDIMRDWIFLAANCIFQQEPQLDTISRILCSFVRLVLALSLEKLR